MRLKPLHAVLAVAMLAGEAGAQAQTGWAGVAIPERARQNYMLKCQGCHRADASGDARTSPAMAGTVARFLGVDGGRDYLARVPGVATAVLDDAALAELLNWTLYRFDRAHLPADFKPYTAAEIGRARTRPLRTEAAATRAALMTKIEAGEVRSSNPKKTTQVGPS